MASPNRPRLPGYPSAAGDGVFELTSPHANEPSRCCTPSPYSITEITVTATTTEEGSGHGTTTTMRRRCHLHKVERDSTSDQLQVTIDHFRS
eukprot:scaffold13533_cov90-Skeletonema_dohrnii-CCMP3373.AAC.2